MEEAIIKVYENDGSVVDYNVLFTFECEELKKSYIVFTKDDVDADGNKIVYVAYYDPEKEINELEPVVDEEELKMANDVMMQVMESN